MRRLALTLLIGLATVAGTTGPAAYAQQREDDVTFWTRLIQRYPGDSKGYLARGHAYYRQRDYARAIADFDQAIRITPHYAGAFNGLGEVYQALKDYTRAAQNFDRAVELTPLNFDSAQFNAAKFHNNACWVRVAYLDRELDAARAHCDAAVRLAPNDTAYLDSRGLVALKQARHQDAWNDYDKAVRLKPRGEYSAYYWYGRGVAALRLGRTSEGQADIAQAKALDPNIAATYARYGVSP